MPRKAKKKQSGNVNVNVRVEKPKGSTQRKQKMTRNTSSVMPLRSNSRYPQVHFSTGAGKDGETIVRGLEVLGEIGTTANFTLQQSLSINPSNSSLFPKLSALARTFEQYHFRKLRFRFISGAPATLSGSFMHYIDYDVNDAPATSSIQLLANQTSLVTSVAVNNEIAYDVTRQMLPKMFMNSSTTDSSSLRESFGGFYRVYTDKGAASPSFAGYLYVEYECCFYTPKPPTPSGGVAQPSIGSIPVSPGATLTVPFPNIVQEVGLPGQVASTPSSAYTTAGGIVGALDYARQVYEAGQWIVSAYGNFSGASSFDNASVRGVVIPRMNLSSLRDNHCDRLSVRSFISNCDEMKVPEKVESCTPNFRDRMVRPKASFPIQSEFSWSGQVSLVLNDPNKTAATQLRLGALNSGDVLLSIQMYDVTNGVIDPDWPVTDNGMTFISESTTSALGNLSPLFANIAVPLTVPANKRYIFRPQVIIGPTTGRTLTNFTFLTEAAGVSDI